MRNLRNNQYPLIQHRHRMLASMVAVFSVVETLSSTPSSAEGISTNQSQSPANVASALTKTIHEKLPVEIDANEQLGWSPAGSHCFMKYVTGAEISQDIDGAKEYFQLKQTGDTLNSVIAEQIKAVRQISMKSPFDLQYGTAATTVGVIGLDAEHQPVTEVQYYKNDQSVIVVTPVGVTTQMDC